MTGLDLALFAVALLIFALGVFALRSWLSRRGNKRPRRPHKGLIEMECSVCQRPIAFTQAETQKLSPAEIALAVRARPSISGQTLVEYTCPHCESAHCFVVKGRELQWLGANLDRPQSNTGRCQECEKPLGNPPWAPGDYDGKLEEAPLRLDLGLKCPRCGSLCCVGCCQSFTRNQTPRGELLCPRCGRPPMNVFWHPQRA